MNSPLVTRMQGFGTTVFAEMSALAARTGAINLGQGFPDYDGPREVLEAACEAIKAGRNQYPPPRGVPELRAAIAAHQARFYGLEVDPDAEVLVTVGAAEAVAASILALCEAGDEVIMFEPYFDTYAATVAYAGATRRTCVLRFPDFAVDEAELRAAFTDETKVVLLNTPHNPTGKVFSPAELKLIASLAIEHDAIVICDEVYEHMTFDGVPHVPIATLPGMASRTLTISSGGKSFSTTGWKVGWLTGPAALIDAVQQVKQILSYVGSGPFQPAIAVALGLPDAYFGGLAADLSAKRDLLCAGLTAAGLRVSKPAGTYFVVADIREVTDLGALDFCWKLPELGGVVGVPVSAFHDDEAAGRSLVRFAFCKQDAVLNEAVERLAQLRR